MSFRGIQRNLTLSVITLTLAVCSFSVFRMTHLRPDGIQKTIVQRIEEITEGPFTYTNFHFSFFPFLCAEFDQVTGTLKEPKQTSLKAEKMKIFFGFWSVLLGRTDVVGIEIQNGESANLFAAGFPIRQIKLKNMKLKAGPFRARVPIHVRLDGGLEGEKKSIRAEGKFILDDLKQWHWSSVSGNARIDFVNIDASEIESLLGYQPSLKIENGNFMGNVSFQKSKNNPKLIVTGDISSNALNYIIQSESIRLTSPKIDSRLAFDLAWDSLSDELDLKSGLFTSPLGEISFKGRSKMGTGEIYDLQIQATKVQLESIPQYLIWLKDAIPFNLGFSGQSDFEAILNGTLDHLSLHANIDLTPALLTYARYFVKPKEVPLNLTLDYLLKDGKILSGDFSVRFLETTLKGNLTAFDLQAGNGSLNLISNKFKLNGWQSYLLPLEQYRISGEMKVLANLSGNFRKPSALQPMVNLTVQKAKMALPSGAGIHNLTMALDYGPVAFEIKQAQFVMDRSSFIGQMMIYNFPDHPKVKMKIKSPHFSPPGLISSVRNLFGNTFSQSVQNNLKRSEKILQRLFPREEFLDRFSGELDYDSKKWSLANTRFETYGGSVALQGSFDFNPETPVYQVDSEIDRLSLARFLARDNQQAKLVDGNLFIKAAFQGEIPPEGAWQDRLGANGSFTITNGEFYGFDLLAEISKISGFSSLNQYHSGGTPFTDVRSVFALKNGKITSDKLLLLSHDLFVEASGEVSWDGILNYRLNAFLSPDLTDRTVAPIFGQSNIEGEKQFGPIPLLLAGPLANPELKTDPELLPQLVDQLARRKTQKIFRTFLPEDFLFERRDTSS